MKAKNHILHAKEVFKIEAKCISDLSDQLDSNFTKSVDLIIAGKGRLVISGVGKSGLIGRKMAATFASTGTPSMFMHPVEAFHGDLGMIKKEDVVIAISYSGETEELLKLIPFMKANKIPLIGMSGNKESTLAKNSDFHLNVNVYKEACPLELAPTSSTTATLAMGDALAVALMKARDFKPKDFAQFHPGGSLGRRLLTTVESCMKKDNLPTVAQTDSTKKVINVMSSGRLGLAVVTTNGNISGIITDGDLRRSMDKYESGFFKLKAKDMMTPSPRIIPPEMMMAEAEEIMNHYKITSLLVANKKKLLGVVQIYNVSN